ncbi:thymidylate kinase [Cryptococcus depauperatus CBS 7841]|uniref:Thymidylate kinase n=1 Tax=Cryptococcus depauperatus CBS 7841 TaxID=1295531 RepID=A0A1E3ICZ6_9TREE|nr:thymidylate kinase [Cryptococcus depauperatus CBS 7841]
MSQRGAFIVLEGLDRCGKSTQVERLVQHIQQSGRKARLQKFPDRTTSIGKMIDAYLQSKTEMDDHAIHLLFSANRWECVESILKDIENGITVIADRYAFSGIAFSAAKGLSFEYCLQPDTGLPLPDVTLYLTLSSEAASKRPVFGSERYETIAIQQAVREQFKLVADQVVHRHGPERWINISADGSIEQVWKRIWSVVSKTVDEPEGHIQELWSR